MAPSDSGVGRNAVVQRTPATDQSLDAFPARIVDAGRVVFRAHLAANGPWWFGSAHGTTATHDGGGRFDLPAPDGTCYVADTARVALRERLGPVLGAALSVPRAAVDDVVVSRLALPHDHRLANTRVTAAADFGVLRELTTMPSYDIPRAWARAFHGAGFDGVAYDPRFTPGRAAAIALFGSSGGRDWPVDRGPVPAADVRGCPPVVDAPTLAQVTVIEPPRTRRRR